MRPTDRRSAILLMASAPFVALPVGGLLAGDATDDPDNMYRTLRDQPRITLSVAGGTISIVFGPDGEGLDKTAVLAWVRRSAIAVTTYFGRFPVAHYGLLVVAESGDRVGHATTFGYRGAATRIHVGVDADRAALDRDWVLVHEMVHAALPDLPRRALWVQEGSATYIEPIAQAQAGHLAVTEVWRQSLAGMPRGEPSGEAGGMDGTRAWGRLYWGGATFWLLAEIAVFDHSGGRSSLREALRAVNRESGGNGTVWAPERLMQIGDDATGTNALSMLYARFAGSRTETDLPALFARLGVAQGPGDEVRFDDRAPLARLRETITQA